jgi:hypothetical protein
MIVGTVPFMRWTLGVGRWGCSRAQVARGGRSCDLPGPAPRCYGTAFMLDARHEPFGQRWTRCRSLVALGGADNIAPTLEPAATWALTPPHQRTGSTEAVAALGSTPAACPGAQTHRSWCTQKPALMDGTRALQKFSALPGSMRCAGAAHGHHAEVARVPEAARSFTPAPSAPGGCVR